MQTNEALALAGSSEPVRSFAKENRELAAAFARYMLARGCSPRTIRAYADSVGRLVEYLGASSVAEVERRTIRQLLAELYKKGITSNSIRLHTCGLRAFFKFIRLTGLTKHDPTLLLAHRKIMGRMERVLTIEEIERLINASQDPFELAVAEVLYGTGIRISELLNLRLEDIDFADGEIGSLRVKNGKGQKDRVVLFGTKAALAMKEYQAWRPSRMGFLFEVPEKNGCLRLLDGSWHGFFYVDGVQRNIWLARAADCPTRQEARRRFNRIVSKIPGYRVIPAKPYSSRAIWDVIHRLAHRAKLGRVHPHMLRRAMACHMLASGANIRAIQDLLGHTNLSTTMLYTALTAENLKKTHSKFHPREQGRQNATER